MLGFKNEEVKIRGERQLGGGMHEERTRGKETREEGTQGGETQEGELKITKEATRESL